MCWLPVILYLEPDGPPQPPGDVEEPLDDQSPFFLWGPTQVSLFPQSSHPQKSLLTLPESPGPCPLDTGLWTFKPLNTPPALGSLLGKNQ